jgi:hypothetical protein
MTDVYTEAQRAAIATAVTKEMERMLSQLLSDELYERAIDRLADAMKEAINASDPRYFTHSVNPLATDRARRLAEEAAESLTRQLTEAQLRSMGEKIARGLEEGKRPRDLYKELSEVKGLDSNRAKQYEKIKNALEESDLSDAQIEARLQREYDKLLNDRRRTIAQTEGRQATSEARNLNAKERGATHKFWITSQDERVSDICAGNEAAGVIAINEAFPSGADTTPGHPNCRCAIGYVYNEKQEDYFQKRQAERIAETAEARSA